ncbi:MAG: hypothetical protein IPO09_07985 [Anaeromyxobacter sp.]|nr:hypothetical protein [Anaeromyxobacter sp.]MBL0277816.1 hypothetical protein [Anaeromyxobacter sp.]
MRTIIKIALAVLATAALVLHPRALAQEPRPAAPGDGAPPALAPATQDDVRALAEELRRLKLELGLRDAEVQSFGGLGPAASKVYFAPKGLSVGGYGEVVYRNQLAGGDADQSDALRLVLYVGYRFSDRLVFNSEVEFEHGGAETAVEFAYLDYRFTDALQLRVGNVLVPVGLVNELHEPPYFHGVLRPDLERNLIPATWNENGLGLHGQHAGLRYQAYLLTGLDAAKGVSAPTWLRNARSGGDRSRARTFAGVLALAADLGPVTLGGSVYRGRAGQGDAGVAADVTLAEVHARAAWRGLEAKALYAVGTLSDAALVEPGEVLGSRVQGGSLELAYDVLALLAPGGEGALLPFVRYEAMDLHAAVPAGQVRDPALDTTVLTAGLTWRPLPTVALKADWQRRDSGAPGAAAGEQVDLGVGFAF